MQFIKLADHKGREIVINTNQIAAITPHHNDWSEGAQLQLKRGITLNGQKYEGINVNAETAQAVLLKLNAAV